MKEIFNYPEEEMEKCMISTDPAVAVFVDNRSASVCFDFGEETIKIGTDGNGKDMMLQSKYCTRIRYNKTDYDALVSEIIKSEYSSDKIEAISANYTNIIDPNPVIEISTEKREEYINDWTKLQQLRVKAKQIAAIVINNYNNIVNGDGKYKNTIETQ